MQESGLSIIIIFFSSVMFCLWHESGKMISLSFFPFNECSELNS